MKKILLLITIITLNLQLPTLNCSAQYVTIPDSNFVSWLQSNITVSGCMSGNGMDTTCPELLNLKSVICYSLNISSLTGIQYFKNLDTLICFQNSLTTLPRLPSPLTYLDCNQNQITSLPALPSSISYFDCSNNLLASLPALPAALVTFNCYDNLLTVIPTLPASVATFDCYNNAIINLPPFPASLTFLDCSANNLSDLSGLPSTLTYLDCSYNLLTGLTVIPATVNYFDCSYNHITSLPALPDSLSLLNVSYNPNLSCMPVFNIASFLYFDSTNIQCVPGYGQVVTSVPVLDTVPLCTASFNPNSCSAINNGVGQFQVPGFRLQVFPNPASGVVNIALPNNISGYQLSVFNVLGQKLFDSGPKTQDTRPNVDLSGFSAGIYFIRVSTAGGTNTVKVVKN